MKKIMILYVTFLQITLTRKEGLFFREFEVINKNFLCNKTAIFLDSKKLYFSDNIMRKIWKTL